MIQERKTMKTKILMLIANLSLGPIFYYSFIVPNLPESSLINGEPRFLIDLGFAASYLLISIILLISIADEPSTNKKLKW